MVTNSSNLKKLKKKHNMPSYCSCGVIQVPVSPDIQIWLKNWTYTMFNSYQIWHCTHMCFSYTQTERQTFVELVDRSVVK